MLKLISTYNSFAFKSLLVIFYLNFYISTNIFHYNNVGHALAFVQSCHCARQLWPINSKIKSLEKEVVNIKETFQNKLNGETDSDDEYYEETGGDLTTLVRNLKNEVDNLKANIDSKIDYKIQRHAQAHPSAPVNDQNLQALVNRLNAIEKKPLMLIENFNKQILTVVNSFLKNIKYTNWYGLQFTHRVYLEELYEGGELKYKFYLIH